MERELRTSEVAKICDVHYQTVLNYCKRGLITPARDINNHRRFSQEDVEKLKRILNARWPDDNKNMVGAGDGEKMLTPQV